MERGLVAGRMGCMAVAVGPVDMTGHTAVEEEHTQAAAHRGSFEVHSPGLEESSRRHGLY